MPFRFRRQPALYRAAYQAKDLMPAPQLSERVPPYPVPPGQVGKPFRDGWDLLKAVENGYKQNIWVMRAVNTIANNAARLPVIMRKDNPIDGPLTDSPILDLFNFQSSMYESALIFRKRVSQVVLLNRQGAFIEVIYSRMGDPVALYLLPPGYTWPIPDERTFISAIRVQFPGKCQAAGTRVVTQRGVVPIETVQVGDRVFTHQGRWRPVTDTHCRPLNPGEDVWTITAKGLEPITQTGDHKVWASSYTYNKGKRYAWLPNGYPGGRHYIGTEWVATRDLQPKKSPHPGFMHCMTVPGLLQEPTAEALDIIEQIGTDSASKFPRRVVDGWIVSSHWLLNPIAASVKLDYRFGRLLGLYLAEGHTCRNEVSWSFHEDETDLHEEVVSSVRDLFGLKSTVNHRRENCGSRCTTIHVYSQTLADLLAPCGDATTKVVPGWAWGGDLEFLEGLLSGWCDGDGHARKAWPSGSYEVSVSTASDALAWHMRIIAITCGREAYITSRGGTRTFTGVSSRENCVVWTENKTKPGMYRIDGGALSCTITDVRPSEYNGLVYDLTVEDDHSYLTTGGMVHNSWVDIPPQNTIWVREPDPVEPYSGVTPLEAAGLSVESDFFMRMYRRNFLMNDGRPGGILLVNGAISDEDAAELRRRFMGPAGFGAGGAGRITVMESDAAQFVDTGQSPREAQYVEGSNLTKTEILSAFGVPESMIGNASGRTFANADQESKNFWLETMLPHLETMRKAFDVLDPNPRLYLDFDLSRVGPLQMIEQQKREFLLQEVNANVISKDEYRLNTGRDPVGAGAAYLYGPQMLTPIGTTQAAELLASDEQQPGAIMPALDEASYYSATLEAKAIEAKEANHDGVMVAIYPPPEVAQRLAALAPGGEPASDHHVTLAYLGNRSDWSPAELERLETVVGAFLAEQAPLVAEVSGTGQFTPGPGSDGQVPEIALVSSAPLLALRQRLIDRLVEEGLIA